MTLDEIKTAIASGRVVHWSNSGYEVIKDRVGQYLIIWDRGGQRENCIGLTHRDGATMNGQESDFYLGDKS